ncbi:MULTISPECIES: hypothetical protein [unclassified Paraburkholderia]|uniref:hypothetical protein n=1 Tax=unclassified Paraburkholderia TaxID=2615204 RepID=UPI0038B6ED1A
MSAFVAVQVAMARAMNDGFIVALAKPRCRMGPQIALISATSKAPRIIRGQGMLSSRKPKIFRRGVDPKRFIARENNGAIDRQSRNARYPT